MIAPKNLPREKKPNADPHAELLPVHLLNFTSDSAVDLRERVFRHRR
jgi:hypothetical protein